LREREPRYVNTARYYLNLGPGTYAAEKVKVVTTIKDMHSNSFATKVSPSTTHALRSPDFARLPLDQAPTKDLRTYPTPVPERTVKP